MYMLLEVRPTLIRAREMCIGFKLTDVSKKGNNRAVL